MPFPELTTALRGVIYGTQNATYDAPAEVEVIKALISRVTAPGVVITYEWTTDTNHPHQFTATAADSSFIQRSFVSLENALQVVFQRGTGATAVDITVAEAAFWGTRAA